MAMRHAIADFTGLLVSALLGWVVGKICDRLMEMLDLKRLLALLCEHLQRLDPVAIAKFAVISLFIAGSVFAFNDSSLPTRTAKHGIGYDRVTGGTDVKTANYDLGISGGSYNPGISGGSYNLGGGSDYGSYDLGGG